MVLQDLDRANLRDDLPFAPVERSVPRAVPLADRLSDFSQRWRVALTLVFGTLIAAASFFAYHSQRSDNLEEASPSTAGAEAGGLAPVIEGMGGDGDGTGNPGVTTITRTGGGGSAPAGATTITRDPTAGRSSTTRGGTGTTRRSSTASSGRSSSTRTGAGPASSSGPATVPATTAASPPSTAATTAASPVTTAAPPTTAPTTAAPTTPALPVFIGDQVSYDSYDGAGVKGVVVNLLRDNDRNGTGESTQASATTGDNGRYGFDVAAGCYVVRFVVPSGLRVLQGTVDTPVCLTSGQDAARIDLVLSRPFVRAPNSCEVQTGRSEFAGVEVREAAGGFAPSYAFYDSSGRFLRSTSSLGPPDDVERNPPSQEWTSSRYGFEESEVASVAAEDGNGNTSARVDCSRWNVG